MNNRLIAVLAVTALAFAAFAVTDVGGNDAAASAEVTVSDYSIDVGRTALVIYTLSGTDDLAGHTVTWSVTGTGLSIKGTTTATTSVTNAQGLAFATLTGTAVGSGTVSADSDTDAVSDTVTVTESSAKKIAVWGVDDTSRMYVFQYTDKAIMVDTKYMSNMAPIDDVYVKLTYDGKDTWVGPLSAKERIWVDGTGNLGDGEATVVGLYFYEDRDAPLGQVTITPTDVDAAGSMLAVDPNRIDMAVSPAATEFRDLGRSEAFDLGTVSMADLKCDTYTLTGFAATEAKKTIKNPDGTIVPGTDDIPLEEFSVEELLMLASEKEAVQSSETVTIYANWSKTYFTITYEKTPVGDIHTEDGIYGVELTASSEVGYVAVISGSTVIGSEKGSYAIVSIVKETDFVNENYIYRLSINDKDGAPVNKANYDLKLVNNGTWKLTDVKESLWISAVAVSTEALETGFDLQVSSLVNKAADAEARISLALEDYPPTADQTLSMNGTYFRMIDDGGSNVRCYGNIDILTVRESDPTSEAEIGTYERQYTAYVDKEVQTVAYDDGGGEKTTDVMNGDVLSTTATAHQYDLVLKTKAGEEIFLYAVQAVWDTDGGITVFSTPWALYKDA